MGTWFAWIKIAVTFCEGFLGLQLIGSMAGMPKKEKVRCIVAAVFFAIIVRIIGEFELFLEYTVFSSLFVLFVLAASVYRIYLWDAMIGAAANVALAQTIALIDTHMPGSILGFVVTKLLLIAIYLLLIQKIMPKLDASIRKLAAAGFSVVFWIWYVGKMTTGVIGISLSLIWIILLIAAGGGAYVIVECSKWKTMKAENDLAIRKNELIASSYQELSEIYQSRQQLYHDMNNHYLALQGYLSDAKYDKAMAYLNSLSKDYQKSPEKWTGIQVLDMLLNYKKRIAAEKEIEFNISSGFGTLPFSEKETIALFGNALDNAIEACEKVPEGKRFIQVNLRWVQHMTFIEIANSYVPDEQTRKGVLVSTKPDRTMHGLGIKGMKLIIEKYDGTIEWLPGEDIFTVKMSIFC